MTVADVMATVVITFLLCILLVGLATVVYPLMCPEEEEEKK